MNGICSVIFTFCSGNLSMMRKTVLTILLILVSSWPCMAGNQGFTGTFSNGDRSILLRFKPMGNEYHGLLQTMNTMAAIKATVENGNLIGKVYISAGTAAFKASWTQNTLLFESNGAADIFYLVDAQHGIADMDLTPYMVDQNPQAQPSEKDQSKDYDRGYINHERGMATEEKNVYPERVSSTKSPYPASDDRELFNVIAGSQLVYYTRSSLVLSNPTSSSITYMNFCRNGKFVINYDGSFMVEGDYGDSVQGGSHGKRSGTWQLVNDKGQPAVFLAYGNGSTDVRRFNRANVLRGRWRIGNTQYALVRNKVNCR